MSSTSTGSGRDAPHNYIPLDVASHILVGSARRALAAADAFLRIAVGSQGVTGKGERVDVRLRWWQPDGSDEIHVHAADVEALRERFGQWIGEHLPSGQLTPALRASATEGDRTAQQVFVAAGQNLCLRHLIELMKSRDPEKGDDKATLRSELTEKFKTSGRQFNQAWDAAVAVTGNVTWSKAGRRSSKKS